MRINHRKGFLMVFAAFFVLGAAFKVMVLVEGLTEVRPVNAIPPVAGLVFGAAGALACGAGNIAADLFGSFDLTSILGFAGNFIAAWLPYRLWHLFRNESPNLHSARNMLLYIAISAVNAFTTAWILSFGLSAFFNLWIETIYIYVFYNNLGFSVMLGMPVLIILTSDSVNLRFENPPRSLLPISRKNKRYIAYAYAALMAAVFICVAVCSRSPEDWPALWAVSGLAAAGLLMLAV